MARLRWGVLLAALASLTFGWPAARAAGRRCRNAGRPATSTPRAVLRAAVVCLINAERTSRGLPPLRTNQRLNRSAQSWTAHLVRTHTFTHGHDFAARISAAGFDWATAGENIATGFETPRQVVHGWMASAGHCRNILDPQFAWVGTGVSPRSTGPAAWGATWTQDFGLLRGSPAPSGDWAPSAGCPY